MGGNMNVKGSNMRTLEEKKYEYQPEKREPQRRMPPSGAKKTNGPSQQNY